MPNVFLPFQAYKLYGYAEGDKMAGMFNKKYLPKGGIPVLFIPGNSGSAKQVPYLRYLAASLE